MTACWLTMRGHSGLNKARAVRINIRASFRRHFSGKLVISLQKDSCRHLQGRYLATVYLLLELVVDTTSDTLSQLQGHVLPTRILHMDVFGLAVEFHDGS